MIICEASQDDAPSIASVHIDTWRTTYRGIISDQFLDSLSYKDRQVMWESAITRGGLIYVVEQENNVVKFVACGKEREGGTPYDGEINAIYLLQGHHGKGWGKQLFLRAIEQLKAQRLKSMMLWVLADNPSLGFYQAMGGKLYTQKEIEIGGETLLEVSYGWENLESINS
jgi:L-amino acid N-acyltransferase YncA